VNKVDCLEDTSIDEEVNMKLGHKEIGWEGVGWINLAWDRDK
jgi:hypothetical protein